MATVNKSYDVHVLKIDPAGNMLSADIVYIAMGCNDEADALEAVRNAADSSFQGVPLSYIEIEQRDNATTFHVKASYEKSSNNAWASIDEMEDQSTVSFDCGGGTKHVDRAISHRHWGSRDSGGLIGWNGKTGADMQVSGVDIPTAQLRESYTTYIAYGELVTGGFKRQIASFVGCVNNKEFFGWQPGEMMFLGASFSNVDFKKRSERIPVTFNFAIQLNETMQVVVNGSTQTITKDGFEYVWLIPRTEISNNVPVTVIDDFFVAKVCEGKDFEYIRSFL